LIFLYDFLNIHHPQRGWGKIQETYKYKKNNGGHHGQMGNSLFHSRKTHPDLALIPKERMCQSYCLHATICCGMLIDYHQSSQGLGWNSKQKMHNYNVTTTHNTNTSICLISKLDSHEQDHHWKIINGRISQNRLRSICWCKDCRDFRLE